MKTKSGKNNFYKVMSHTYRYILLFCMKSISYRVHGDQFGCESEQKKLRAIYQAKLHY